jgi:hypothetical protein
MGGGTGGGQSCSKLGRRGNLGLWTVGVGGEFKPVGNGRGTVGSLGPVRWIKNRRSRSDVVKHGTTQRASRVRVF